MKLLHLADLHGSPDRADELLQSLAVARKAAQGVDLIAIAGDVWDCVIRNTAGSRFPEMLEAIRSLADVAPVAMIYGTPTHDAEGSLDVFTTLESKFGITILQPGKPYFLWDKGEVMAMASTTTKALLFGVPEPSKKWLAPYFDSKAEAEQAVRDGLRGLFAGLGAIRRQYPDLPCVMLYHGQVGGARLQNGDLLDNGSGIRPSVDDLAAVGADYIAMGDIHEPQRVGESIGLPAYYPGSAYPVNFGETHEAGANEVCFTSKGRIEWVQRVPFGHPVNRKLSSRYPAQPDPKDFQPGARTWVEITCTKEEAAGLDQDAMTAKLLSLGAAPGSRVTLNVLPTETVRAGDIASKTTLREKLLVWGENSKKELPETVLAKADEVEAQAAEAGAVGKGNHIALTRIILRGAVGLWKKSGLDEVDLNLEDIDEGLVALIGSNGAGKTTLLENMHPWPELLTRSGTLKSHFRLKDSFRDLYWIDTTTGVRYRALITINGAVASGSTEYFLYSDTGSGFQPLPGIEGRKEGYIEAVDRIFGSKELYLRSAFVTQRQPKDLPDLADATPGQRKTLFSALCGTDYLEAFKLIAKGRGDAVEAEATTQEVRISTLAGRLPDRQQLEEAIAGAEAQLEDARGELDILIEVGKDKAKLAEALGVKAAANRGRADRADEAHNLAEKAAASLENAKSTIQAAQGDLSRRSGAEATVAEYEEKTVALNKEQEAQHQHLEAIAEEGRKVAKLREEFDRTIRSTREVFEAQRKEHLDKVAEVRGRKDATTTAFLSFDAEARANERRVKELEQEAAKPIADHCPTCRQMLPEEALAHVQEARKTVEDSLANARAQVVKDQAKTKDLRKAMDAQIGEFHIVEKQAPTAPVEPVFQAPASTVPAFDDTLLKSLKTALDFLDVDGARRTIAAADQAQARIEELTKQLDDLAATADREGKREAELLAELDPGINAALAEAQRQHQVLKDQYREAQRKEAMAAASLEQARSRLQDLAKDLAELDALKQALAKIQAEVAEWRVVEFACSDKGIQALELDAFAPTAMVIANGLLKDAFGSRYALDISTTKLSGTGKAQKQIEVFDIMVMDTQTGESQEIATLSGGEAVWIRRALYDAFGLIRARSTDLQFLTVFQDEADGALDPASRLTYLRMLESAHRQAGRRHTIIITHSPELQELIQSRVEVAKLKPRPQKDAVAA